jgi:hypothetical protein
MIKTIFEGIWLSYLLYASFGFKSLNLKEFLKIFSKVSLGNSADWLFPSLKFVKSLSEFLFISSNFHPKLALLCLSINLNVSGLGCVAVLPFKLFLR